MIIKIKDLFTIGTIICGFLVLVFAAEGALQIASLLVILGTFLDLMDGFYARITGSGNKFGAEFDCIADLIIFNMAPGILLFFYYRPFNLVIASTIGVMPLIFGCIRLARFNVKRIEYPGFWMGFPRPGSAWTIVGFVNSHFFPYLTIKYLGIGIVLLMGIMNVSLVPYIGHHARNFSLPQKILLIFLILALMMGFMAGYGWDVVFFYGLLYLFSPLYVIPKKEWEQINAFVKDWKRG